MTLRRSVLTAARYRACASPTTATVYRWCRITAVIFEGKCWKFGHNIPTDEITPTSVVWKSFAEMAKHVLESLNPEFPGNVQKGDIIVAGRNFGCSSGRAIAPKAIKATGVAAVIAEGFSRTFYRHGHEV